jgi:quinol monooxygenase YgiN
MTVALYAEFTAAYGRVAEVAELLSRLAAIVRAEPGNLQFQIHRHAQSPERFFVYEVYRDQEAFEAHLDAASSRAFNDELASLIEEPASALTMLLTD